MLTVNQLREEIGDDCREVLTHIWTKFLEAKEWPESRIVHSELNKEFVVQALSKTNGSVVLETFSNGLKKYKLVGVGPLLTDKGQEYQSLLVRYLEHLRHLYLTSPATRSVSGSEIEKILGLSKSEGQVLCHLIILSNLFCNNASPGIEGWSVGVFDKSEDFPAGPLNQILETLLLRPYNTSYPVLYDDVIAKLSGQSNHRTPTPMDNESSAPKVFLSYSHDSAEHRRWVMRLAVKLRSDGVIVILDEWHVGPGEDLAIFMEESIAKADRVLLICTENYVTKMDNRLGGVGYEAVVSSGELMKNLATNKFIPVVRQKGKDPKIPRVMGTRYRINLSHRSSAAAEYEKLLRSLHGNLLHSVPPLGNNPFQS